MVLSLAEGFIHACSNPVEAVVAAIDINIVPVPPPALQTYTVPVSFSGATVPDQVVPTNDSQTLLPADLAVVTTYPVNIPLFIWTEKICQRIPPGTLNRF